MRNTILLMAVALAGCQAAPETENKAAPLPPMGSGPLQDREFTRPLLGVVNSGGAEAVLKMDSAKNQIYFGVNVRGKVTEDTFPFTAPDLMNIAGRLDSPKYLIQFTRADCKSTQKDMGGSTITATVNPKAFSGVSYTVCLIADWPKDAKLPSWSKVNF